MINRIVSDGGDELVEWLVDINYPFDMTFDPPPPVDVRVLARRWNERDKWGVSEQEAFDVIVGEVQYC